MFSSPKECVFRAPKKGVRRRGRRDGDLATRVVPRANTTEKESVPFRPSQRRGCPCPSPTGPGRGPPTRRHAGPPPAPAPPRRRPGQPRWPAAVAGRPPVSPTPPDQRHPTGLGLIGTGRGGGSVSVSKLVWSILGRAGPTPAKKKEKKIARNTFYTISGRQAIGLKDQNSPRRGKGGAKHSHGMVGRAQPLPPPAATGLKPFRGRLPARPATANLTPHAFRWLMPRPHDKNSFQESLTPNF